MIGKRQESGSESRKQRATAAFQLYGRMGSPPAPELRDYGGDLELYHDLHAVAVVFSILADEGKDLVIDALKEIYIKPFSEGMSRKKAVDSRVVKFSMTRHVSERTVYRYLSDSRRLFISVRYPGEFV